MIYIAGISKPDISKPRAQRVVVLDLAVQIGSHKQRSALRDVSHRLSQRFQLLFPRDFPTPHSAPQRPRLLRIREKEQTDAIGDENRRFDVVPSDGHRAPDPT